MPRAISVLALFLIVTCGPSPEERPLSFAADGQRALVNGYVAAESFRTFEAFVDEHPEVRTLVFDQMPGSADDDVMLQIARDIHARGLATEGLAGSWITSGAVDMFVAGTSRRLACGADVGVHSWKEEEDDPGALNDGVLNTADEFPRDASLPVHKRFIDYYRDVGLPDPEGFYWFTTDAAPFDGIHLMSADEINRFGLTTVPMDCPLAERPAARN